MRELGLYTDLCIALAEDVDYYAELFLDEMAMVHRVGTARSRDIKEQLNIGRLGTYKLMRLSLQDGLSADILDIEVITINSAFTKAYSLLAEVPQVGKQRLILLKGILSQIKRDTDKLKERGI